MSRILIEYDPKLSAIGQKIIEENVTPSMTSNDGSSNHYAIDIVAETLKSNNLIGDLTEIDILRGEGVSYIEF